jgi:branched-chain amino acid transport system substrate-binding protein
MQSRDQISRRELMAGSGRAGMALVTAGGLGGLLAACGADSRSTASSSSSDEITLGHLISRTGAVSAVGQAAARGVRLRIDAVNAAGGIDGTRIKLVEVDDQSKPEVAAGEIAKLSQRGVQLTIASVGSPAMLQATQEAERERLPIVNAVGVFDEITDRGFKYTFTACGKAGVYTEDFVKNLKGVLDAAGFEPRRVGVLFESDIQGPFYADWMRKFFPQYTGWDVVYLDYPLDTTDFGPLLSRLRARDVDVVVLASYAKDGALILEGMNSMRYDVGAVTGCMGGLISREFITTAKAAAEGFQGESYWVERLELPGQREFLEAARAGRDGPVDPFTAIGYAAAAIAVDTLQRAPDNDRETIRETLASTSLETGDQGFILPGGAKFDETGANTAVRGVYYEIDGGEQKAVRPREYAVDEATVPHEAW